MRHALPRTPTLWIQSCNAPTNLELDIRNDFIATSDDVGLPAIRYLLSNGGTFSSRKSVGSPPPFSPRTSRR